MKATFYNYYSKEFEEEYKDWVYPLKGLESQTIDLKHFDMIVPRVGDIIQSFPIHEDGEFYDLVVISVEYQMMHDEDGCFVTKIDKENTYNQNSSRISIHIKELKQ